MSGGTFQIPIGPVLLPQGGAGRKLEPAATRCAKSKGRPGRAEARRRGHTGFHSPGPSGSTAPARRGQCASDQPLSTNPIHRQKASRYQARAMSQENVEMTRAEPLRRSTEATSRAWWPTSRRTSNTSPRGNPDGQGVYRGPEGWTELRAGWGAVREPSHCNPGADRNPRPGLTGVTLQGRGKQSGVENQLGPLGPLGPSRTARWYAAGDT